MVFLFSYLYGRCKFGSDYRTDMMFDNSCRLSSVELSYFLSYALTFMNSVNFSVHTHGRVVRVSWIAQLDGNLKHQLVEVTEIMM